MDAQVEKMIEDNKRLVYSIANSMYIHNKVFSKDDLIQVGFLALCKSGHKYDSERGKVSTFITHCVRNDMIKFIKSNKLQSDLLYTENQNLSYNNNQNLNCLDHYDICGAKTDLEKTIVKFKIKGETNKNIAENLKISANKVSKILSSMKARMERRK
jgi:RNA polymerase sigma factor (sigma-70 family)